MAPVLSSASEVLLARGRLADYVRQYSSCDYELQQAIEQHLWTNVSLPPDPLQQHGDQRSLSSFLEMMQQQLLTVDNLAPRVARYDNALWVRNTQALKQAFVNRLRELIQKLLAGYAQRLQMLAQHSQDAPFHIPLSQVDTQRLTERYHQLYVVRKNQLVDFFTACLRKLAQVVIADTSNDYPRQDATVPTAGAVPKRFEDDKLDILRQAFIKQMYPNAAEKTALAEATGLSIRQVSTWFMNARSRGKKGNAPNPDLYKRAKENLVKSADMYNAKMYTQSVKKQRRLSEPHAEAAAAAAAATATAEAPAVVVNTRPPPATANALSYSLPHALQLSQMSGATFDFGLPSPLEGDMSSYLCARLPAMQQRTTPTPVYPTFLPAAAQQAATMYHPAALHAQYAALQAAAAATSVGRPLSMSATPSASALSLFPDQFKFAPPPLTRLDSGLSGMSSISQPLSSGFQHMYGL
ncbi:hypothetical protein RI367_000695 [Sorochytrium milnesiophthora]